MLCYFVLCLTILCYIILYLSTLYYIILYCISSCDIVLYHIMLYYIISYYIMLLYVLSCSEFHLFHSFDIVGYGCMTCIGNSGPLPEAVAEAIEKVS